MKMAKPTPRKSQRQTYSGFHLGRHTSEELESIRQHGILRKRRFLQKFPASKPRQWMDKKEEEIIAAVNRLFEEVRPKNKPSRENAIFFEASLDAKPQEYPRGVTIIEASLPGSAYVFEKDYVTRAVELVKDHGVRYPIPDHVKELAKSYWGCKVRLSHLHKYYELAGSKKRLAELKEQQLLQNFSEIKKWAQAQKTLSPEEWIKVEAGHWAEDVLKQSKGNPVFIRKPAVSARRNRVFVPNGFPFPYSKYKWVLPDVFISPEIVLPRKKVQPSNLTFLQHS